MCPPTHVVAACYLHQRYKSVRKGRPQRAPSSGPRPVSTSSHCPQTSLISEGMSRNCFQIGNPFLKAPRAQLGPAQAIPISTLPPGGVSGCGCPQVGKLSSGLFCSWSACPGCARSSAGHSGIKKRHLSLKTPQESPIYFLGDPWQPGLKCIAALTTLCCNLINVSVL